MSWTKLSTFILFAALIFSACVSKRKKGDSSALGRFYHNTTGKYNAYFNANELLKVSIQNLERQHKDNYSEILPVFPYNAVASSDGEKANLDKVILKASTDISMHRISRWADDCYYLLAKAQYLKKDYETAEESYKFLLEEYSPQNIIRNSKKLSKKSKASIKKEKEIQAEEKKEAAAKSKKEKASAAKAKKKAKETARKKAQKKKKSGKSSAAQKKMQQQKSETPSQENQNKNTVAKEDKTGMATISEVPKTEKTPNVKNVGSKLVPHRPIYWEASVWAAKNLVERGKYYEALSILKDIDNDLNTPESVYEELYACYAHVQLRQNKLEAAIPYLKKAVEHAKSKKHRSRYAFILGQIYQRQNRPVSSDEYFTQVIQSKPNYEMRFQANMNLLLNQGLGSEHSATIEKDILKLLKDPKNADYEPEIYYSLAQIARKEGRLDQSVDYLKQAVGSKAKNNSVKANAYLQLADIHFERQSYTAAKLYYDSTVLMLPKNDERRSYPSKMVSNLQEIATQIDMIALQDSLIRISALSTKEKRALAIQIKNKNKAKFATPDNANPGMDNPFNRLNMDAPGLSDRFDRGIMENPIAASAKEKTASKDKASSYFAYDQRSLNKSRSTFEQVWGVRTLEDNWRRSNKTSFSTSFEEITQASEDKAGENLEEDLANILKGIPSNDQELAEAHNKIQNAMFRLGVLYREKIDQYRKSKETHLSLLEKYAGFERREDALYYIYLNCLDLNESDCADMASNELKSKFPNSRYTQILTDPSYVKNMMNKKDELVESYHHAYRQYDSKDFESAYKTLSIIKTNNRAPHPIDPKIHMLYAMCVAKVSGKEAYINELKNLVSQFPSTPEESRAKEILRFLKGDQDAFVTITQTQFEETQFKLEDSKTHYVFLVVFDPAEKQMDKIKIALSDYHNNYHRLDNLKMTTLVLDKDKNISIILIRQFEGKNAAMKYVSGAQRNQNEYIPGFVNYEIYAATQANYRKVLELSSVKEYQAFFNQNYNQ